MKEVFKDYPLDNRYKVSNLGNVIGVKGFILKPFIDSKNRAIVKVSMKKRYIHQLVAETFLNHTPCGHKIVVDHIDNNTLNNSKYNLQLISHRENLIKDKLNKTSPYRGVSKDTKTGKYRSQVMLGRKTYYLGLYGTAEDAYVAYIDALYEYDEFITLN